MAKEKKSIIFLSIKIFAVLVAVCALVFGIGLTLKLKDIKADAVKMVNASGSEVFKRDLTTIIYDCEGNEITKLKSEKNAYYLKANEIPQIVKDIFVTTEDKKFYSHDGVDKKAVIRAIIALIENEGEITQGGSTITQQLAKNVYLTNEVSINRKLTEMYIAKELEKMYSKEEILEFYINNIYFANGLYGVQTAARGYFGKDVKDLSISQTCYICAIPNSPEMYNPFTNDKSTIERRDRILRQLLEDRIITKTEYEEAVAEKIEAMAGESVKNNYVDTFVKFCATKALMEQKGFEFRYNFKNDKEKEKYTEEYNKSYGECNSLLFTGGYRIYTSIDIEKQNMLQSVIDEKLSVNTEMNDEGIYKLQASAVSVDNDTGFVVAAVGGRTSDYEGYTLNRAYQSFRQPGSAIKPILVYTPLFEIGYTPDSMVTDEKISGGPVNSPNVYDGEISIRKAIAYSKNTVAWKMFEHLGYSRCIRYLLNMKFTHIVSTDYVPAMSIGGMTYGVSTYEMASAYSTIENNGNYRDVTCIVKIEDSFGKEIVNNEVREEEKIYDSRATSMITDVMQDVLEYGTGKNFKPENAICAAKTGTTNDNKDSWFVGFSKYYSTAVWVGYDMPRELIGDEIKAAGSIWKAYMEEVHIGKEKVEFDEIATDSEIENEEKESTSDKSAEDNFDDGYIDDSNNQLYTEFSTEHQSYESNTKENESIYNPSEEMADIEL